MNPQLESFRYDDAIVRKFLWATFIWGLIGMTVGLLIALQLALPALNLLVANTAVAPDISAAEALLADTQGEVALLFDQLVGPVG